MKRLLMIIPLVCLFCFIVGCQQSEEVTEESAADVEADVQAIRGIVEEWEAAFNAADINRIMPHYADDAMVIPPNEPVLIGKEAIRSDLQQLFEQITLQEDDEVKNVHISGDLGVAHVAWSTIVERNAGAESSKYNGNQIIVFKKLPDGAWKCIYSIWSDETLTSPPQAD